MATDQVSSVHPTGKMDLSSRRSRTVTQSIALSRIFICRTGVNPNWWSGSHFFLHRNTLTLPPRVTTHKRDRETGIKRQRKRQTEKMRAPIKTAAAIFMLGALFLELVSDDVKNLLQLNQRVNEPQVVAAAAGNMTTKTVYVLQNTTRNPLPRDYFCVPWSVNTDKWWTHHPEFYNVKDNATHTCFRRRTDSEARYLMRIYHNQYQRDCGLVYTRVMWSSGWGADFINVVYGLINAVEFRRPLAIANFDDHGWHYSAVKSDGSNPTCPAKDLSCYFLPMTNCAPRREDNDEAYPNITYEYEQRYVAVYNYVTRPYQWLRREVYHFVHQLEQQIVQPCSVMHVRRTDVVLHGDSSRKYYPVSAYVDLLPEDRRQDIFLLTDDADAIDEAHEFYPNLNWHYINRTRFRGAEGGWENQTPSKNPKQEVVTILGTFKLAKRCDTFVHGHSVFSDEIYRAMTEGGKTVNRLRVDETVEGAFGAHNSKSVDELKKTLAKKRKELQNKQGTNSEEPVKKKKKKKTTNPDNDNNNEEEQP